MSSFVNFSGFGPLWNWLLLGLVLLGLELLAPGVHFVWFGFAAMIVALIVFVTGMAWGWQLLAFAIIAASLVLLMRGYASPLRIKSDQPDLNARGQQYVGRRVLVTEAIVSGRGKVKVGDTIWGATGPDLPAGTTVQVTSVDGIVLVVAPVKG